MTLTISLILVLSRFFRRSFSPWLFLGFLGLFPLFSLFDVKILHFMGGELKKEYWLLSTAAEVFFLCGLVSAIKNKSFSDNLPLLSVAFGVSSFFTAEGYLLAAAIPGILEYLKTFIKTKELNPSPFLFIISLIAIWKTTPLLEITFLKILILLLSVVILARLNTLSLISALFVSLFGSSLELGLGAFFWLFVLIQLAVVCAFVPYLREKVSSTALRSKILERLIVGKNTKRNFPSAPDSFLKDYRAHKTSRAPSKWSAQENLSASAAGFAICLLGVVLSALWWGENV